MVRIRDEGAKFDVPIEVVWRYVQQPEDHNRVHQNKNVSARSLSDESMEVSWDRDVQGQPVHFKSRVTALPPIGVAIEMLEGPMEGSKFLNIYTPNGNRTQVDVIGEFTSKTIPPAQLEPMVHGFLDQNYAEDSAALNRMMAGR